MVGKGRLGVLAVHSADPVLSLVAPLGLAASVGTCLVVDVESELRLRHPRSLSDIAAEGPRLEELSPGHRGVAVLGGGGVEIEEAVPLIERLGSRWPGIVVRVQSWDWPGPTVPVRVLYPGWLAPTMAGSAVWQPVVGGSAPVGPGPVLPRLSQRLTRLLLTGRLPRRSRWVSAWRPVWELPWA